MHGFQFLDAKKPASFKANSPEVMASLGIMAIFTMEHAELLGNHDLYQGRGNYPFDWFEFDMCMCTWWLWEVIDVTSFYTPSGPHFLHKYHIFPEIAGTHKHSEYTYCTWISSHDNENVQYEPIWNTTLVQECKKKSNAKPIHDPNICPNPPPFVLGECQPTWQRAAGAFEILIA